MTLDRQTNHRDWIRVKGARTHNLKDVDVDIPRDCFVVVSGVLVLENPVSRLIHCMLKDNVDM